MQQGDSAGRVQRSSQLAPVPAFLKIGRQDGANELSEISWGLALRYGARRPDSRPVIDAAHSSILRSTTQITALFQLMPRSVAQAECDRIAS